MEDHSVGPWVGYLDLVNEITLAGGRQPCSAVDVFIFVLVQWDCNGGADRHFYLFPHVVVIERVVGVPKPTQRVNVIRATNINTQ